MKGKGKLLITIGGIIVVSVALLAGLVLRQDAIRTEQHAKALTRAKSLGLGVDNSFYDSTVPDSKNAAVQMKIDFKKSVKLALPRTSTMSWTPGANKSDLTALVASAPQAAIVEKASTCPDWEPKRDYSTPFLTLFPEMASIKGYVKYFCYKGYFESELGNWQQATEDFKTAARLSSFMRQEKSLIGALVQVATNAIVRSMAAKIVVGSNADPRAVNLVQEAEKLLKPVDFKFALQAECAMTLSAADYYCEHPGGDPAVGVLSGIPPHLPANRTRLKTSLLNYYSDLVTTIPFDSTDYLASEMAFTSVRQPTAPMYTGEGIFYEMAFPIYDQAMYAVHKDSVARQLLGAAIQILKFKRAHGSYPTTLADLQTKKAFIDPYTGKDFLYVVSSTGFALYSAGHDGVDSTHGVVPRSQPKDIMFQTVDPTRQVILGQ